MTATLKKLRLLLLPLAALLLAQCETPVTVQKLPDITFGHMAPLSLDVAVIDVVADYRPPLKAPNVDHLFPTPPVKALRVWASDRLKPVGRTGVARFVIKNASATETKLKQEKGFVATFTKQQSHRYDIAVDAILEITDGAKRGHATANATRYSTLREDAAVNDRNRAWFDMTEALMADFDKAMEANIRQHLVNWLR